MVSIDEYIHQKAKEKDINISHVVNSALRLKIKPTIKDLPSNALTMHCTECGKEISFGFFCEILNRFFCDTCHAEWRMSKCPDSSGEHRHIRIPGFEGQNMEMAQKIAKDGVKTPSWPKN